MSAKTTNEELQKLVSTLKQEVLSKEKKIKIKIGDLVHKYQILGESIKTIQEQTETNKNLLLQIEEKQMQLFQSLQKIQGQQSELENILSDGLIIIQQMYLDYMQKMEEKVSVVKANLTENRETEAIQFLDCNSCPKIFATTNELKTHIVTKHCIKTNK